MLPSCATLNLFNDSLPCFCFYTFCCGLLDWQQSAIPFTLLPLTCSRRGLLALSAQHCHPHMYDYYLAFTWILVLVGNSFRHTLHSNSYQSSCLYRLVFNGCITVCCCCRMDAHGGHTKLDVRHPAHFDHQGAQVWRVEWNVTGTTLASSGDDGCIRLWKGSVTGSCARKNILGVHFYGYSDIRLYTFSVYTHSSQLPWELEVYLSSECRWWYNDAPSSPHCHPYFPPLYSRTFYSWTRGSISKRETTQLVCHSVFTVMIHTIITQCKLGFWESSNITD